MVDWYYHVGDVNLCHHVLSAVAVKCNGDPAVLRLLAELGIGFDCASKVRLHQIIVVCLHFSVDVRRLN